MLDLPGWVIRTKGMDSGLNRVALALASLWLIACGDNGEKPPEPPLEPAEDVLGALGEPIAAATDEQLATFGRGREVALRRFTRQDGLGPSFNVSFCGACHEKPTFGGGAGRYRNFLLSGQRLSDDSFTATGVNGGGVQYSFEEPLRVPDDDQTNVLATRNPIPFFGAGLLAEISGEEILSREDPDDEDGDGISGRANFDRGFVGRFGRKSQTVSIEGFIRGPLFNHLGLTTNPLSEEMLERLPVPSASIAPADDKELASGLGRVRQRQAAAPAEPTQDNDGVADPELSEQDLFDLVSFSMLLAGPQPEELSSDGEEGQELFLQVGCANCHTPELVGPRGTLPVYSDLLLHDMGEDLADGIVMLGASGSEFRTQPLWGVSAVGPYLHDGRADTLDEAIRLHGGEAKVARDNYVKDLSPGEQDQLIEFLLSLGGRDQMTLGLLPPDAELPEAGELGGPLAALSGDDRERFERGREVFDRDFALHAGLGRFFNGDSCRACHFEPIIGGAGPVGVNVTRHGLLIDDAFELPSIGTMAHKLDVRVDRRAPIDEDAKIFEHRQTPPLFGLGLVDRISAETILALEDPDDADGDGISGRAHVLGDGRLGRLGWKANVPSLAEFARDAMSNEMGISVPEQDDLTFGFYEDADDIDDPEVGQTELDDLVFFMAQLAPPKRRIEDKAHEQEGKQLFEEVGCANCHVPSLQTEDGQSVPLYSDLLLHDVAPEDFIGVGDGQASAREFRTPPLWGLGLTAPYMHDGHSPTIEHAIERHAAEGQASVDAYAELTAAQQAGLLAFLRSL